MLNGGTLKVFFQIVPMNLEMSTLHFRSCFLRRSIFFTHLISFQAIQTLRLLCYANTISRCSIASVNSATPSTNTPTNVWSVLLVEICYMLSISHEFRRRSASSVCSEVICVNCFLKFSCASAIHQSQFSIPNRIFQSDSLKNLHCLCWILSLKLVLVQWKNFVGIQFSCSWFSYN